MLSLSEYRLWMKYRAKFGSLNHMMRTELAGAIVASTVANINRKKDARPFTIADFAPHIHKQPVSLEEAMQNWY